MKTNITPGFIALFSALIIATLLTLLVITSNTQSFFSRFDEFDRESHTNAQESVSSCGAVESVYIEKNFPQSFSDTNCTVMSLSSITDPSDSSYTIFTLITEAHVNSSFAHAKTIVHIHDPSKRKSIPLKPNIIVDSSDTF